MPTFGRLTKQLVNGLVILSIVLFMMMIMFLKIHRILTEVVTQPFNLKIQSMLLTKIQISTK